MPEVSSACVFKLDEPLVEAIDMAVLSRSRERHRTPPSPRARAVIRGVFFLSVCGFLAMAIVLIAGGLRHRALEQPISGGVTVSGTVIEEHVTEGAKGYAYGPVVAFTDTTGGRVVFTPPGRSRPAGIGSRVVVSYDPRDPAEAHDLSDKAPWQWQLGTGVFILALSLVGIWLVVRVMLGRPPIGATSTSNPFG
jgi:hypothetical protein